VQPPQGAHSLLQKMKLQFALTALAVLLWPSSARGLKGSAQPRSVQLEAENESLKKRNKHLEAMMQVARAEVHRMDDAKKHRHVNGGGNNVEVLNQEVEDLQDKLHSAEADRKSLVQTLRQMLSRNATHIFQTQAEKVMKSKQVLETKCGEARMSCEAQVKEANGKSDEAKEVAQTLQEQNMDLQRTVQSLRAQLAVTVQKDKDLKGDKANLVATMHSLMREGTAAKKALRTEKDNEKKELQEIAADKVKLAKLAKKAPKPAVAKQARKIVQKNRPLHLNHEESTAYKIAKMNHINRYIDRQYASDDRSDDATEQAKQAAAAPMDAPKESDLQGLTKQVDAMQNDEDVLARKRQLNHSPDNPQGNSAGISDWLGLKVTNAKPVAIPKDANGMSPIDALDPDAVKQEKAAVAKKAKSDADDGGDGIEDLLAQAKNQLSAMDRAESENA